MERVYRAIDGTIFEKRNWCLEYEELLRAAEKAVENIKFREIKPGWNLDPEPIKNHEKEDIWDAWARFLEITKELVVWSGVYKEYIPHPGAEPEDIEEKLLTQLSKYSEEHLNIFPISLSEYSWPGFLEIRRRFASINFENGEEYVGSFGNRGMEGRKDYLKMIEDGRKDSDS